MAFDIKTASPIEGKARRGKFDITTARPIEERPPIGNILPRVDSFARFGSMEGKLSPVDIATGNIPMQGMNFLSQKISDTAAPLINKLVAEGQEKMGDMPVAPGLMNVGTSIGMRLSKTPAGREIGSALLTDPRTYMTGKLPAINEPSIIASTKPLEALTKAAPEGAIGQKGLSIMKLGRDYLYNKVAKPAAEIIRKNIIGNPEIGEGLGLKPETIDLIKKHGHDVVANVDEAERMAKEAFDAANAQKTSVYGDKIDIRDTLAKMEKAYSEIKKVDPNNPIKRIIDNLKRLQPARGGFYSRGKVPTPMQVVRQLRGENLIDIAGEVRISRTELASIRDQLTNLYRERGFDRKVFDIIDSLYSNAEKSGLKGIQRARELFKNYKQFGEVTGNLKKVEKLDSARVLADLNSVHSEPNKFQMMVDKYTPYVGKDTATKIFNEAMAVRRGQAIRKVGLGLTGVGVAGKTALGLFH